MTSPALALSATKPPRVAGVEFGGTKVMVAVGDRSGPSRPPVRLDTGAPGATLDAVVAALRGLQDEGYAFAAIGVAGFGPLGLDPARPDYGRLLNTPKPGWSGVDLLAPLREAFGLPLTLETDVSAAAIAEGAHAAKDCATYAYITVGTGVGVGVVVGGRPVHGAGHPEAGHLLVRQRVDDHFGGVCFAHGTCIEGLISGPALQARLGEPIAELGPEHPCWDLTGDYLAQLCMSLVLTLAPQRIVIGGGVGARPEVLEAARRHLFAHLAGYLARYQTQAAVDALLVRAVLEHSGLGGALIAAADAAQAQAAQDQASRPA